MNPNPTHTCPVIAVENFNGVWCDAWIIDQDQLVFASLWGRSSRILALYGAITARQITSLDLGSRSSRVCGELDKCQRRLPAQCRYGSDFVHVMIFDAMLIRETAGQRILIGARYADGRMEPVAEGLVFRELAQMANIGLLASWQAPLMQVLREQGIVRDLEALGVQAVKIDLADRDAFESLVSSLIKTGQLREAA
ncbi:hypothetical protein [Cardiobacterium hominis]|uniref:hypothetical protein n=1 Tax=Cardiobacterium hominis TaxID=2718 RepID=UPI0028EA7CF4|nr:hypothetical protein [Cardiobacterium hominis]